MTYTDATLQAFLVGEMPEQDARVLEAQMLEDRALERRIMALDAAAAPVAAAMQGLPDVARIKALQTQLRQPRRSAGGMYRAALALAAVLVAGIGLGWSMAGPGAPQPVGWRMQVALYQALYVPETIAYVETDPARLAQEFERASEAVGLALPGEALAQVEGVDVRRAQVLGFGDKPLIQIAFRDADGTPFALCLIKGSAPVSGAAELAGLASYTWSGATHQFLLIGGTDQDQINDLAQRFQAAGLPAA